MDYPLEDYKLYHMPSYDRLGNVTQNTMVTFFLGKHGPFYEKWPTAEFSDAVVNARIEEIRRSLMGIGR